MGKIRDFAESIPYAGRVISFPRRTREFLKTLPIAGPLVFTPLYAAKSFLMSYPKFFFTRFMMPFAVAGVVTAGLSVDPDWTSEPLDDFLDKKGFDKSLFDGVAHKNIRIYTGSKLWAAFHLAGQQAKKVPDLVADGLAGKAVLTALSYPGALISSFAAVNTSHNAFSIPIPDENGACYIVANEVQDMAPEQMISALAGVPESFLNSANIGDAKWIPEFVLLHEAGHCDNGKQIFKIIEDAMRQADIADAQSVMRKIQLAVLVGETGSDIYAMGALIAKHPDTSATVKFARAISPFARSMEQSNGHATAAGIDAHLKKLETADNYEISEAIDLAKLLVKTARSLNSGKTHLDGWNETLENYHAMKNIVMPWLEQKKDAYFPRDKRHIRLALVLDQARLFVEGMEYLVKADKLKGEFPAPLGMPDLKPAPAPAYN